MSDPAPDPVEFVGRLRPEPLQWLWRDRLAFGKPALLDGDPGQGKSLVALDLCARLSTGRDMPDGTPGPGVIRPLILQAEDGTADTLLPRLHALGADINQVLTWRARHGIRLPTDAAVLRRVVADYGVRFVLIDPVVAYFARGVFLNSDQSVRAALEPLDELAEEHRCAVLLVRHLNKGGGRRALYRGAGSIGLAGACRSVWLIGQDPDDPNRHVLAESKNNLGPPQPSLAYAITLQPAGPPVITWLGPSPYGADHLVSVSAPSPQRDRAAEFLAALLRAGPRRSQDVWAAAEDAGIADRTLRRAADKLGIVYRRVCQGGARETFWLLKGQQLPDGATADPAFDELQRFFAEQEQ